MRQRFLLATTFGLVLLFSFFFIRHHKMQQLNAMLRVIPEQPSPLDSMPFQKQKITLSDRVLVANFLSAGENARALFVCTGNGEALFEWMPLQSYFLQKGISSYVFSYSGFGNSSGTPTAKNLSEDVLAAYEQFVSLTKNSERRIALTQSLGGGVLLDVAAELRPLPDKLIIHGPASSIRSVLLDGGLASESLVWLWPDIYNSAARVKELKMPILYVHSKNDQTSSYRHSLRLMAASGDNADLLLLDDYGHNAIYENVSDTLYQPILAFIDK